MLIVKNQHKKTRFLVSSQNGRIDQLESVNSNEGKLLFGGHRNITVSDPALAQRVTDLENQTNAHEWNMAAW